MSKPPARKISLVTIVGAFTISRLYYFYIGNRILILAFAWHFLDPPILRSDLLRSIYYLHSQPPLLNLWLGLGLKLLPNLYPSVFQLQFAAMGLAVALMMFALMDDLGVGVWLNLALTLLFEIGPATLYFENYFFTSYPTLFLLCAGAFCLSRFLRRGSQLYGAAFSCALALPVFLNSSFQPLWFVGVGGILFLLAYRRLRSLLPWGLVMLALILALCLKNFLVFGTLTTSSWAGMNLAKITTFQLPIEERQELVHEGKLSTLALIGGIWFPAVEAKEKTGIPVLDEGLKSQGAPWWNYNNLGYVDASRQYLHDAIWVIVHRPRAYLHGITLAAEAFLQPADFYQMNTVVAPQVDMPRWRTVYRWILIVRPTQPRLQGQGISMLLLIALPALIICAVAAVARVCAPGSMVDASDITLLFITLAVLYLTAIGILLEVGENMRFRYVIDPLYIVLGAVFLSRVLGLGERPVEDPITVYRGSGRK